MPHRTSRSVPSLAWLIVLAAAGAGCTVTPGDEPGVASSTAEPLTTVNLQLPPPPPPPGPCATPYITGGLGTAEPGHGVMVFGCGFGAQLGKAELLGDFTGYNGSSSSALLTVTSWGDKGIGLVIPDMAGVYDQTVSIRITTAAGYQVVTAPMQFTALRETVHLTLLDFQSTCGAHWTDDNTCLTTQPPVCNSTVCAFHKQLPNIPGFQSPTDEYTILLNKGWVYESYALSGLDSGGDLPALLGGCFDLGTPARPSLAAIDPSKLSISVTTWSTGSCSWGRYNLDVWVTGPKGTPTH